MIGKRVIIIGAPEPCWNGETGRITHVFTGARGAAIAVVRLSNIALEVCFPVSELAETEEE
jgi:hypothetical protein